MTDERRRARARGGARLGAVLAVCLAGVSAAGCARPPARPPVLLVTVHGLRADVVRALAVSPGAGAQPAQGLPPALTPQLDAFAAAASWSGRAVAPSSAGAPALASLFTGLRPWQTQVLYDGAPLSRRFDTLPSVLAEAGYHTAGFTEEPGLRRAGGFVRGFDVLENQTLRARAEIERRLCGREPGFVWAHFDLVGEGYQRHDAFLDRLPDAPSALPQRLTRTEIERWSDPATPPTPSERAAAWALYQSGVAEADTQLGALLDALRACKRFDDALIAVVGDHGEAIGEGGRSGHGGALSRREIEVPLALKLPRGAPALVIPAVERVATTRLFATVLSALGLGVPPAVAPPLTFRNPGGAESELYRVNGENQFSLLDGDLQLVRLVRFADPDPDYYAARRALVDPAEHAGLARPPKAILNQLTRAFHRSLPFRDRGEVRLTLWRWLADGGVRPVDDPATAARLDADLERSFFRFVAEELTPAQARRQ